MITFNIQRTLDKDDMGSPEFNHVYQLHLGNDPDGSTAGYVTDQHADGRPWGYAPDVTNSELNDIEIATTDSDLPKWQALTGNSGQHGYTGAVMHPSEQWSQCHIDDLLDAADQPDSVILYFAIVEVRDEDGDFPDGDPIGWAVVYTLGGDLR